MTFKEFQKKAVEATYYVGRGQGNLGFPALALAGEVGEVCNKVKKVIRDRDNKPDVVDVLGIREELGDALFYLTVLADELNISLDDIAKTELKKIKGLEKVRLKSTVDKLKKERSNGKA